MNSTSFNIYGGGMTRGPDRPGVELDFFGSIRLHINPNLCSLTLHGKFESGLLRL